MTDPVTIHEVLSEQEFSDRYRPVPNPNSDPNNPDYRHEFEDVKDLDPNKVWSVVEGDDEGGYALAGFHVVNRLFYLVTEVSWETGLEEGIWWEPMKHEDDEP